MSSFQSRLAMFQSSKIVVKEDNDKENEPFQPETRRSNQKLENSKLSKYQKSGGDGESPKSGGGSTNRLDMSKFALFQKKSEDSTDSPPKKNFTIKKADPAKKSRFGNQGQSSTDSSNKCHVCEKRVYPMDKIAADGRSYHKTCFRCAECKKVLNLGTFAQLNSVTFCKPHFKQRFKLHGNYDFSANNLRSGSSAVNNSS